MASNLANHQAIVQVKTVGGVDPQMTGEYLEDATQTYLDGTPVELHTTSTSNYVRAWDGTTFTEGILGIDVAPANNLATAGLGAPSQPFGSVGVGAGLFYGSVPNQSSAHNIPPGAPMVDGRRVVYFANRTNIFEAQIDSASGATSVTSTSMIGKAFGLTKDATGHWYVDVDKVTDGTNTCVVVTQLNPNDPVGTAEGRVWFVFQAAVVQVGD